MTAGGAWRRSVNAPTVVIAALALCYGAVLGGWSRRPRVFDPLDTEPHAVEELIVAGRFAEALPRIEALRRRHPGEWLPTMWLARAHEGLGQWPAAAAAWEEFVHQSPAPADSCPSLPRAYEQAGDPDRALAAYERCARFDPSDPGPIADLGAAYLARGRTAAAAAAFGAAIDLAPDDPALRRRAATLAAAPPATIASAGRQP